MNESRKRAWVNVFESVLLALYEETEDDPRNIDNISVTRKLSGGQTRTRRVTGKKAGRVVRAALNPSGSANRRRFPGEWDTNAFDGSRASNIEVPERKGGKYNTSIVVNTEKKKKPDQQNSHTEYKRIGAIMAEAFGLIEMGGDPDKAPMKGSRPDGQTEVRKASYNVQAKRKMNKAAKEREKAKEHR